MIRVDPALKLRAAFATDSEASLADGAAETSCSGGGAATGAGGVEVHSIGPGPVAAGGGGALERGDATAGGGDRAPVAAARPRTWYYCLQYVSTLHHGRITIRDRRDQGILCESPPPPPSSSR